MAYIIGGGLVLLIAFLFFSALADLFSMFMNIRIVQDITYPPARLESLKSYLREHPFFLVLSQAGQKRFLHRTVNVMVNKRFTGKGIEVTEEMRVRISACIVQLTFGLEEYTLPHFDHIYIFPEEYYHPLLKRKLKGGTYGNEIVSLSWKHFVEGFKDPADHFNLGLHEFAHALKLEVNHCEDSHERFAQLFPEWHKHGIFELEKMKLSSVPYFRKYAATNIDEFFAVCVEYFFERSQEFQQTLPDLYYHLCYLLNQNPLHTHNDFQLDPNATVKNVVITETQEQDSSLENVPVPVSYAAPDTIPPLDQHRPATYKQIKGKFHWSLIITVTGPLIGIPALLYLLTLNCIHGAAVVFLVAGFALANSISVKYFRRRGLNDPRYFAAYSILGVGIWATVLLLSVNYLAPKGERHYYTIDLSRSELPPPGTQGFAHVQHVDDPGDDYPWVNLYLLNNHGTISPNRAVRYYRDGLFGIETLRSTMFYNVDP